MRTRLLIFTLTIVLAVSACGSVLRPNRYGIARESNLPALAVTVDDDVWVARATGELRHFDGGTGGLLDKRKGPPEITGFAATGRVLWITTGVNIR